MLEIQSSCGGGKSPDVSHLYLANGSFLPDSPSKYHFIHILPFKNSSFLNNDTAADIFLIV